MIVQQYAHFIFQNIHFSCVCLFLLLLFFYLTLQIIEKDTHLQKKKKKRMPMFTFLKAYHLKLELSQTDAGTLQSASAV